MIQLRFVTDLGGDFISWAIRGAELGFWASHVEAIKPDGSAYLGARAGSGVQWAPKGYDAKYHAVEQLIEVPATDAQTAEFWAFLEAQIGAPYDDDIIKGFAAGMLLGQRDWHESGAWICSELQAAALEAAGVLRPFPQGKLYITPESLLTAISQITDLPPPPPGANIFIAGAVPARPAPLLQP
jgi:hypothetical protein